MGELFSIAVQMQFLVLMGCVQLDAQFELEEISRFMKRPSSIQRSPLQLARVIESPQVDSLHATIQAMRHAFLMRQSSSTTCLLQFRVRHEFRFVVALYVFSANDSGL